MSILSRNEHDTLRANMEKLLNEYDYNYSQLALDHIIETWADEKKDLITAFKKHPNYVEGEFLIAFNYDYDRVMNPEKVRDFMQWIIDCPVHSMVDSLPNVINTQRIEDCCYYLPNELWNFIKWTLSKFCARTITEEMATKLNHLVPEVHAHNGQKTSRVINKLFTYLGYDKHPEYNRRFAEYADSLSPLTIKRHTVLSLNPLDYLTMSFGNSWASCHTIDKSNKRGMPNSYQGQYSSGTMSYMLDPSSMVFYTVHNSYDGTDYWTQPKINRQMFHYGEDKLVQGRLYPQDNDDCKDEYTLYRNIVQEIFATILDVPNLWSIRIGTSAASKYIYSRGTHYQDYVYYDNCSLSTLKGSENEEYITVGANPICIECGYSHTCTENINCCDAKNVCDDCGCLMSEEDTIWIAGESYCSNCVEYCERCGDYHRGESYWVDIEERYVCECCIDNYYYRCENCGTYIPYDEAVRCHDCSYVCQACYNDHYDTCDNCGEVYHQSEFLYDDNGDVTCPHCANALNEAC